VSAPAPDRAFRVEPYAFSEARALAAGLGVSDPVAITLVRRGYRTVEAAREFLDARETHDPFEFDGMEAVVERLLDAVRSGRTVTVHGDYDVDGVCSTAILVGTLRRLGARCDWFIPDRLSDGYGLTEAALGRLASRGTGLLLTADCGITAVDEVAAARAAGIEVIVTDHHTPGERLPDCPIVHPRLCGYPCPDLCATGVAYKLSAALGQRGGLGAAAADEDLDLVALATVADLVPLVGENRSLVRRGLAEARRGNRPGLRALVAAAGVEPSRLDEGDVAFRLAPRINAAGRLYRADAGVELLLCEDEGRAGEIAAELDRANSERRGAELEVLAGAEAALAELPDGPGAPGLVLAGEGWHPGVIGIVASRLAERHWRPTVLIGLEPGAGRGSGRSIPGFDLLSALHECGDHLIRFGGHSAAAGLEIDPRRLDSFRDAFVASVAKRLEADDLVRTETVDAVVGGDRLGLETAEELARLGPFGIGNPGVRLLVPAARMRDIRPMGEGRHARFNVESGPARALGVAFGSTDRSLASHDGSPVDLSVRLEVNQWNGAVEPRVVLKELYPIAASVTGCVEPAAGEEWWGRLEAERAAPLTEWPPGAARDAAEDAGRETVEHAGGSGVATLADLISSGAPVLALCADSSRRAALAERADPRRFGCGPPVHGCGRCAAAPLEERLRELGEAGRGLALADWEALGRDLELARRFEHVVLIDPPPFAHVEALAARGTGYLHRVWGDDELEFAFWVHANEWELRGALTNVYRAIRTRGGEAGGDELLALLAGQGPHPRTPEVAGRCVRVLEELKLAAWDADGGGRSLRVVSSEATELERSTAYDAYRARHEEGRKFLSRQRPRAQRAA
jgi:single-stranded-DNA-specific exonuclease